MLTSSSRKKTCRKQSFSRLGPRSAQKSSLLTIKWVFLPWTHPLYSSRAWNFALWLQSPKFFSHPQACSCQCPRSPRWQRYPSWRTELHRSDTDTTHGIQFSKLRIHTGLPESAPSRPPRSSAHPNPVRYKREKPRKSRVVASLYQVQPALRSPKYLEGCVGWADTSWSNIKHDSWPFLPHGPHTGHAPCLESPSLSLTPTHPRFSPSMSPPQRSHLWQRLLIVHPASVLPSFYRNRTPRFNLGTRTPGAWHHFLTSCDWVPDVSRSDGPSRVPLPPSHCLDCRHSGEPQWTGPVSGRHLHKGRTEQDVRRPLKG